MKRRISEGLGKNIEQDARSVVLERQSRIGTNSWDWVALLRLPDLMISHKGTLV
jgi:hypothetical protein